MDYLLKDNFELKKDLALEKKKYIDLMNAFLELRNDIKKIESEKNTMDGNSSDVQSLISEKMHLT
jgi:hypothetical protein